MASKCSTTNGDNFVDQRTDHTMEICERYHMRVFKQCSEMVLYQVGAGGS